MREKITDHLLPPITAAKTADEHLAAYITRDLAHRSGITRAALADLDPNSQQVRRWNGDAAIAARSILSWIATNAPAAVAPLREVGLLVYTPDDAFGTDLRG